MQILAIAPLFQHCFAMVTVTLRQKFFCILHKDIGMVNLLSQPSQSVRSPFPLVVGTTHSFASPIC